ncbi:hypothetical protein [Roseateles sp. P5_E7]
MTRILALLSFLALWILFGNMPCRAATGNAELHALMRSAFPTWRPRQVHTITAPGADGKATQVTVTPRLVLPLDDNHRTLVVSGVEVIQTNQRLVSHASSANLGIYVFEQRDGRWVKTRETPSAGWTGFFGEPGKLSRVELGAGRVGLAVENGSCWQGSCGQWLTLFAITPGRTQRVLDLMTASTSVNATMECRDWLKGKLRALPEHYDTDICFDISSHWQLTTAPGQDQADVVIQFTGRDTEMNARTGTPSVRTVRQTLVLRQQGPRYEVVSGRNPTHKI